MTSELSKVPTLDLNKFNNGSLDEQKHFVSEIGDSFNQIGFAIIKNHGLDSSLVDNLYDQIKNFFYLEDHIKKQYEIPEKTDKEDMLVKEKNMQKEVKLVILKSFIMLDTLILLEIMVTMFGLKSFLYLRNMQLRHI